MCTGWEFIDNRSDFIDIGPNLEIATNFRCKPYRGDQTLPPTSVVATLCEGSEMVGTDRLRPGAYFGDLMTKGIAITAIGSVIAGLVLQLSGLLPKVVSSVWGGASWIVGTLESSHSIPSWAVLALGLLALFGIIAISMTVKEALGAKQEHPTEEHPFFVNYTEDMVDGVRWRWKWAGGSITNLWCFCPTCDAQLVPHESMSGTRFICERCHADGSVAGSRIRGRVVTTLEGQDAWYLVAAAEREILRRVRQMARELPPG